MQVHHNIIWHNLAGTYSNVVSDDRILLSYIYVVVKLAVQSQGSAFDPECLMFWLFFYHLGIL